MVFLIAACSREGQITQGGIYITRSSCPQVGIPAATGDITDASIDPLSRPQVRDAVARATFEHLIGFQLTQDQLVYNATR